MLLRLGLILPVWLIAASASGGQDDPDQDRIRELVKQLGSEDYEEREEADRELRKIGKPAVEELRKAAESEDLEVRERAIEILKAIGAGRTQRQEEKPGKEEEPPKEWPAEFSVVLIVNVGGEDGYTLQLGQGIVELKLKSNGKTYRASSAAEFKKKFPKEYEKYVKRHIGGIRIGGAPKPKPKPERTERDDREEEKKKEKEKERDSIMRQVEELRKLLEELTRWMNEFDKEEDLKGLERILRQLDREKGDLRSRQRRWAKKFRDEMERGEKPEPRKEVRLGLLMSPLDPETARTAGIPEDEGVSIIKVYDETPSSRLGFVKGDILHKINGHVISNALQARAEFSEALRSEEVRAEIIRNGEKKALSSPSEKLLK
jgi:hypothetical protein